MNQTTMADEEAVDEEGPERPADAGAALREDDARLRAVFRSTSVGMAVLTPAARFVQVNEAFCALTGYSPEELRALDSTALTHPDDIASQQALLEELLAGRRSSVIIEKRYRRKDGTLVWVQNDVSLVRDTAGQPLYLVAICQNVTQRQQAREALRASEQRYRELVLALPAAIYTTDAAGRITLYNEAAAELWGRRPEIGRDLWCGSLRIYRMDGAALPHEACPMAIALQEGRFTRGEEIVIERPDGTRRCALAYPHPLRDASGAVVGAMNMLVDVTDLRESEERFRTLADNMSQLAWMADGEGWIFWYNRRWFEYTGTTLAEMQGWGWQAVHHPDHVERVVQKVSRHWQSGEVWEDTFPLRGADGTYRWFLSRTVPIRDDAGHVTRWFGTNTDITEQLAAEQALKDADRRKDEFLAMLAHELRNPLAPISNAVQVMRLKSLVDPQLVRARDVIERQVGQMSRLVGDLLDVSRITRGKIKLDPQLLDLNEVAAQAVESVQSLIDQRGHRLAVSLSPAPLLVAGDPTRLAQVVINLLNNAVKFTDPGGRIDLSCEPDGEAARLVVRDTGIGIAPELLPHIFDLFTQADQSLDRVQGGLGIGLSLVYRLVQLHGGTITAASAGAGQGSEFVVRLPLLDR